MRRLHDEYVTALDLTVTAVHWLAATWYPFSPGVAAHLRRIADHFAVKLKRARDEHAAYEEKTEIVTRIYGEDNDKTPRP
jgi:hypothetical protein